MQSIAAIDIYIYADSLIRNQETFDATSIQDISCSAIRALTFPPPIVECVLCCINSSLPRMDGLRWPSESCMLIGFSHAACPSITCFEANSADATES